MSAEQITQVLTDAGLSLDLMQDDGAQVWSWLNDMVMGTRVVMLPRGTTTREDIETALAAADIETFRETAGGTEWVVWVEPAPELEVVPDE